MSEEIERETELRFRFGRLLTEEEKKQIEDDIKSWQFILDNVSTDYDFEEREI